MKRLIEVAARLSHGDEIPTISQELGISERTVFRCKAEIESGRHPDLDEASKAVMAQYREARLETTKAKLLSKLVNLTILQAEKEIRALGRLKRRRGA